jgi:hypothetical protein
MKSLLILLAVVSFTVHADEIARQGDDWVRFTEKPCTNETILSNPLLGAPNKWRAASAFFMGQHYEACWQEMGWSRHVVYEDGDQGLIPEDDVKPLREI